MRNLDQIPRRENIILSSLQNVELHHRDMLIRRSVEDTIDWVPIEHFR